MRRKLIIGNWKMNKSVNEAIRLVTELRSLLSGKLDSDVVIAPPFTTLHPLEIVLQGSLLQLGAQDAFYEDSGAYTGAISAAMLADLGCKYVVLGHSERRSVFGENDRMINKKVLSVLDHEMVPVLCVGETADQRANKETFTLIEDQLREGLRGVNDSQAEQVVVAYEPIWAIGTGQAANPGMAQEVHAFIREKLGLIFRKDIAQNTRIIYGGSVTDANIAGFLEQADIDGALVGGASLDSQSFSKIVLSGE